MSKYSHETGGVSWNPEEYQKLDVSHLVDEVLKNIIFKDGQRILVVGCGDGRDILPLNERAPNLEIVAFDFDPEMVEKAAVRVKDKKNIKVFQADVTKLNTKDHPELEGGFDAIVSVSVLHWVKDLEIAFKNIGEMLKPGGQFACEFARQSPPGVRIAVKEALEAYYGKPFEIGEFEVLDPWQRSSMHDVEAFLGKAGFAAPAKMTYINRDQKLQGPDGMKNWLQQFVAGKNSFLRNVPAEDQPKILNDVVERLKRNPTYYKGSDAENPWSVWYSRIAVVASKEQDLQHDVQYVTDDSIGSLTTPLARKIGEGFTGFYQPEGKPNPNQVLLQSIEANSSKKAMEKQQDQERYQ